MEAATERISLKSWLGGRKTMDSIVLYCSHASVESLVNSIRAMNLRDSLPAARLRAIAQPHEPIAVRPVPGERCGWRVTIEVENFQGSDPGVWVFVDSAEASRAETEAEDWIKVVSLLGEEPEISVEVRAHHTYQESRLALEVALFIMSRHHAVFGSDAGAVFTAAEMSRIAPNLESTVYKIPAA